MSVTIGDGVSLVEIADLTADATPTNTNEIVSQETGGGSLVKSTIAQIANVGSADSVTLADTTDATSFPVVAGAATGNEALLTDASNYTYNATTGILTVTGVAAAVNGTLGATTPAAVAATTITGSGILTIGDTTQATNPTTASVQTNGGIAAAKNLWVGGTGIFDDGAQVIIGHTAGVTIAGNTTALGLYGTAGADSRGALVRFSADAGGPILAMASSRSATIGAFTAVTTGDNLGELNWYGDDGTDLATGAATIRGSCEGTVGSNRMPGKLDFQTATDAGPSVMTSRMTINSAGLVNVVGEITAGTKTFRIPHPVLPDRELVHLCIEAPRADLIYRGETLLSNGRAEIDIDDHVGMALGTFEALCRDVQCFTTNESGWTEVKGSVVGNKLILQTKTSTADLISWLVVGERQDEVFKASNTTDRFGNLILEPEKVPLTPERMVEKQIMMEVPTGGTEEIRRRIEKRVEVIDGIPTMIAAHDEVVEVPTMRPVGVVDENGDPVTELVRE